MDWTEKELQAIVDEHFVLFMKGTNKHNVDFPTVLQVLQQLGEPFAAVNILTDQTIPSVCAWSDFPTITIFVHGELIGGSDIALEIYKMVA